MSNTNTSSTASVDRSARPVTMLPLDLVRGFLIGAAELVPGVSGGTVALVTGVYEELIGSASHVLGAGRALLSGADRRARSRAELRRTQWRLILPVLAGMALAVITVAGVMSAFVTDHPEHARGLFFGLVAVSIIVPVRMLPPAHRSRVFDVALVAAAAAAAYVLVSLAGGATATSPPLYVVFFAAAVAVCALVVPGVSGSFLLLAVGLYTATLDAVSQRDVLYLAVFGAGAVFGLASFVQLLGYLLRRHRHTTLLTMTGLMAGSLRALWPWQSTPEGGGHGASGPGELLAPTAPIAGPFLLMALGAAVVLMLVVVQARSERKEPQ